MSRRCLPAPTPTIAHKRHYVNSRKSKKRPSSGLYSRTQWGIVYKGKADNLIRNGVVLKIDLVGKTDAPESK